MFRQAFQSIRLFLDLFQNLPPLPRRTFLPGIYLLMAYPLLAVLFGPHEQGQAFVTAFLLALAVRISVRFEDLIGLIRVRLSNRETAIAALAASFTPLALIAAVDDPVWCQRLQSVYFLILGSMFVSDALAARTDLAGRLWPFPALRPHLSAMTRAMVLFYLAMLVLNETMMRAVEPSHWLLFWALLPVLSHLAQGALIATVIQSGDDTTG